MVSNILQGTFKNSIFAVLLDLTQKVALHQQKSVFFMKTRLQVSVKYFCKKFHLNIWRDLCVFSFICRGKDVRSNLCYERRHILIHIPSIMRFQVSVVLVCYCAFVFSLYCFCTLYLRY